MNAPPRAKLTTATALRVLGLIALLSSIGLFLCSLANALSRATDSPSMLIYWGGIVLITLPIFYRLTSRDASPRERLVLVCMLGLALYGVKVVRDAPLFTFSDELVHAFNANQIISHRHLFEPNSILKVTPYYPGLEGATSALATMTGLSSYVAGVIVVGAARLSLSAALFLLFRRISGSARIAGLGAAIYAANFNFLFWGAQFSYESLALPLLLVIVMALAEREAAPRAALRAWAVPIVLGMVAVLVTHHLTSYALAVVIAALAVAFWWTKRTWSPPNPWRFGVLAAILAAAWLFIVANSTIGYLSPVLGGAIKAVLHTIGGEAPPRQLFGKGNPAVGATPLVARAVALLAIAVLLLGLPFGLLQIWRRHRRQPFALIFAFAAICFFGTLALRLTPPAWETGNRASEYLFIGLAFVLAYAGLDLLRRLRSETRPARALLACALALVLVGDAISGWPWDMQLSRPLEVSVDGATIASPPLAMARWASHNVYGGRFAAPAADANLLLDPGGKAALTGPFPDVEDVLSDPLLANWELPLLHRHHLRYVVGDLRTVANDGLRGYYFSTAGEPVEPKGVVTKFNRIPGTARVYANGPITVFDLEGQP